MKFFRKYFTVFLYLILIPLIIALGVILFNDRKYGIISMIVAFLSCLPFFWHFEKKETSSKELVIIAVMISLSVVGRIIFAPLPGFKPVTAIVIISGIALGPSSGFITGSFSALVSNIFYGQGPWTPFQMFVWGIIGFISGIIFNRNKEPDKILLIIVGIIGGILFSLMMDIWSTISIDGEFIIKRYLALVVASFFPFMAVYAVSNVVFLLLLTNPILEKLKRVINKYGLFQNEIK